VIYFNFGIGNRTSICFWDLSFVVYLLGLFIYWISYIFNGVWKLVDHAVKRILYIRCMHIMRVLFCVFCMSMCVSPPPPPPPPYTLETIVLFLLYFKYFFKDTLYFLLKYVLPPVLFTLTQVVLLLITSTFTRVRIQSNLGTTGAVKGISVALGPRAIPCRAKSEWPRASRLTVRCFI
jgi:hypothetical protein